MSLNTFYIDKMGYIGLSKLLDFVLRDSENLALVPPTIYYSKVGFELSKLVIRGQKMSTPYVVPSKQQLSTVNTR